MLKGPLRRLLRAPGFAIAVVATGLYAVLNVTVRRRTGELVVRMALGATRMRLDLMTAWRSE